MFNLVYTSNPALMQPLSLADLYDAIVESGRSRLRPVLMTTFTTLFGMLPMTISRGIGSEIWSPLAVTIIGGLLVSTMVTLVLVPVMYLWLSGSKGMANIK